MVYCGKPSKGCQACRERKTRCDKATPSCTQCIRAHRACPGYRNQLDLMFRIQNTTVIEKSKAEKSKASKPKASKSKPGLKRTTLPPPPPVIVATSHPEETFLEDEVFKHSRDHVERIGGFVAFLLPNFNSCMSPSLEQRARWFFATHSAKWNPAFDLVDTLCTQTTGDDHLLASINAVGLVSFAHSVRMPELMVRARQDYVVALRLTNAALRSPTEVKKDSTLFSVMILSTFETIAGTNADSLVAWTEHINGAAALVKLRGRDQFKTEAGLRMFQQVTSNLMVSCIQRTVPIPAHIIELRETIAGIIDTSNPVWKLSNIIVDFTVFRAAVRGLQINGPRMIVEEALEFDRRFLEIFEYLPKNWKYEIVYTDENPHSVWNKYYHVYQDSFSSQIWNGMRTCRILLHEIIRDQLLTSNAAMCPIFTDAEEASMSDESAQIMMEMQADILASVPQDDLNPLSGPASHSLAYFILWPLYLVGVMDLSTDAIRLWVSQRLRTIANEVGIQQAGVMADFLERRQPTPMAGTFGVDLNKERFINLNKERVIEV